LRYISRFQFRVQEVMKVQASAEPQERLFTIAEAAKYLDKNYNRLKYAISNDWLVPFQKEPVVLFTQSELERYRQEHLND
jgi:hypothetical protein